jgi:mannose-1-phosphate guanylyltransferase
MKWQRIGSANFKIRQIQPALAGGSMYIILMAGGVGTRFWPVSKSAHPKQLLNILSERSMVQLTYDRVKGLTPDEKILVITNIEFQQAVRAQLPELHPDNIIAEPFGRNTAPCIALAAAIIKKRTSSDEVMVALPADHLIDDIEDFRRAIIMAAQYASKGTCLITIGIRPDRPETGYGYIQKGEAIPANEDRPIYRVKTFAEKPNVETAQRFLESGDFLWNSGIFIWSVGKIGAEFDEFQPDIAENFGRITEWMDTTQMDQAVLDVYSKIKSISIDYGVMELSRDVCIIEADFSWNDLGSWEAVYNISPKDERGNSARSKDFCALNSDNNFVYVPKRLVALCNVSDLVIVETEEALLVCKKEHSQGVKELVELMKRKKMEQYL